MFWPLYWFLHQGVFTEFEAVLSKWPAISSTVAHLYKLCQHTQHSQDSTHICVSTWPMDDRHSSSEDRSTPVRSYMELEEIPPL